MGVRYAWDRVNYVMPALENRIRTVLEEGGDPTQDRDTVLLSTDIAVWRNDATCGEETIRKLPILVERMRTCGSMEEDETWSPLGCPPFGVDTSRE